MQALRAVVSSALRTLPSRSIVQSANAPVTTTIRAPTASLNAPHKSNDREMKSVNSLGIEKNEILATGSATRRQAVFAGSDPIAPLKAMLPIEAILGVGLLISALLPRPLGLAAAVAALLPPLFRVVVKQREWNRAVAEHKAAAAAAQQTKREARSKAAGHDANDSLKRNSHGDGDTNGAVTAEAVTTVQGVSSSDGRLAKTIQLGGTTIYADKMAAGMTGDFCLFLIGARNNSPFKLTSGFKDLGDRFTDIIKEMEQLPESEGFLGGDFYTGTNFNRGSHNLTVLFWRSYDDLIRYSHASEHMHRPAWTAFSRVVKESPELGIWHESYIVKAGQYEGIYVNCPAFGLGAAGGLVPATGALATSKGRVKSTAMDEDRREEDSVAHTVQEKTGSKCPFS